MATTERLIQQGRHSRVTVVKRDNVDVVIKDVSESEYYENELVTLLELGDHPHIIEFIEADKGRLMFKYYPMDLFAYACDYALPYDVLRTIIKGICSGLEFMHSRFIAHGDIKLENVLIDNGNARLCDFGYSRPFKAGVRTSGVPRGSYNYISPQVLLGKPLYRDKADIWALGILVYVLFHDSYPYSFDRTTLIVGGREACMIAGTKMSKPPPFQPINDDLTHLCHYLLTYDDDERPSMADVMAHRWLQSA